MQASAILMGCVQAAQHVVRLAMPTIAWALQRVLLFTATCRGAEPPTGVQALAEATSPLLRQDKSSPHELKDDMSKAMATPFP